MNMQTRWFPGDVLVAIADGGILALDGSAQVVEALWNELGERRALGDLLRSLSRLHDNEVFTLPDFLVMTIDGHELRVAARGHFELHLDTADGERSFSAPEVIVWEEARYDQVHRCILELAPAGGPATGPESLGEFLPLKSGIVRASQLHIGFGTYQLPSSLKAREETHAKTQGDEEARMPAIVQEIVQEAQVEQVASSSSPAPSPRPATHPPEAAAYAPAPDPGQTLDPESFDLLSGGGPPTDPEPGAAAAVPVLGPDDVPVAAQAADPQIREQQAEDEYFGHLFERTMMTGVEAAAIRSVHSEDVDPLAQVIGGLGRHRAAPLGEGDADHGLEAVVRTPGAKSALAPSETDPATTAPAGSSPADDRWRHDGRTVSAAELHAAREALTGQGTAPWADEPAGPSVLAVFCEAGHPNPVHASSCRECDAPITSKTSQVERPPLGVLRASSGASADLDADVIIGRVPQGTSTTAGQTPHLLAVPSPSKAISKTHCAVRVEGWDMSLEDLGSTNGTFLLRAGEEPRRVPEHQQLFLRIGDVIDIGDGTTLTVEHEA